MSKFVGAKLIELFKRVVKFDAGVQIHQNGIDNAYPDRIERIIDNSPTAKAGTKLLRKYIVGKGFSGNLNDFIVNKEKNITLKEFLFKVAHSYSRQNGVFIHVNYNLAGKIISLDVLPYSHCRKGKKDDAKYVGKIAIYDNWSGENGAIKKDKIQRIDIYNPLENIITSQVNKANGIDQYKGQVMFYNPEETDYPLAHIDPVMNDADSEYRSGNFKNLSLRKGFFGKKIVVTPPMVDGDLKNNSNLDADQLEEKRLAESERENFRTSMQSFVGSDNADGMLHLEMEFEGDDISKIMSFIDVKTDINDKLFEYTEKSAANNICKSLENIPKILIENPETSVFGQSGEMLKSAKLFYQEQTEENRGGIENKILKPLMKIFEGFEYPKDGLNIIPLIDVEVKSTPDEINK